MTYIYYLKSIVIILAVLAVDQLTKYLTDAYIPLMGYRYPFYPYGGIPVFKDFFGVEFSISHATNTGAAWGAFGNYQIPLLILRLILIIGLIAYLFLYNKRMVRVAPLALIIAGAIGNVFDFFLYGHVIDMFHFVLRGYDFPVFNVADCAISIGIGLFFVNSLLGRDP